MTRIVLGTASAELEEKLAWATAGECMTLPFGPLPDSPAALFARLDSTPFPDVLVLDCEQDAAAALHLAAQFEQQFPMVSVVLVSDRPEEIGLAAMRSGVRDIVDPAADVADVQQVVHRAAQASAAWAVHSEAAEETADPTPTGRVVTVVSPKGGVGKTTVATNLAVALAATGSHSTVLVDLDIQFGDVGSALDLEPDYFLNDAVQGPASRDTMVLKTFLTLHSTGLYVICGPRSPADADSITGAQVSHLLQMLASEFAYVVVDTAPGLSEHVLAAMDVTDELVLVTSMDVPGVRGLRKELEALGQLGMLGARRHVVLNFADTKSGLSVADIEATLAARVDLLLPRTRATLESVNQGVPLLQTNARRDATTKQLHKLVARLTALTPKQVAAATPTQVRSRKPAQEPEPTALPKRATPRWVRLRRTASS